MASGEPLSNWYFNGLTPGRLRKNNPKNIDAGSDMCLKEVYASYEQKQVFHNVTAHS